MSRLVRAELLKLRTARATWAYLTAAVALAALTLAVQLAATIYGGVAPRDELRLDNLMIAINGGQPLLLVLGINALATERRHRTWAPTLLAAPARGRVLAAKAVAVAVAALIYGLVSAGVLTAIALPWLSAEGLAWQAGAGPLTAALAGNLAAVVLVALIGLALAAVIPNQVAAVTGSIIWLVGLEPTVFTLVEKGLHRQDARFLPGMAADALSYSDLPGLLAPWQGALVLIGYLAVCGTAGLLLLQRRDVA